MKIEKIEVTKDIILLVFENQKEITSTFLRFQEYYESPEFKGKIFTLEEYKLWYCDVKGSFSYYSDWNGFNIPSYILKPFYNGEFKSLSLKELELLSLLQENYENGEFYLIGIHKDMKEPLKVLKHEIAHGLYHTNKNYKQEIQEVLTNYNLKDFKEYLSTSGGYHQDVLEDECHAYMIDSSSNKTNKLKYILLKFKLRKIYKKYLKSNNINLKKII